jgi:plastocyanin
VRRRTLGLLCAAAAAGAAAVPAGAFGGASPAGAHTVILKDTRFHPSTLSIRRGEQVTWQWRDGQNEHNVTFHGFHSRTQARGSYTVRFNRAGTFSYRCTLHVSEGMVGKVIVH